MYQAWTIEWRSLHEHTHKHTHSTSLTVCFSLSYQHIVNRLLTHYTQTLFERSNKFKATARTAAVIELQSQSFSTCNCSVLSNNSSQYIHGNSRLYSWLPMIVYADLQQNPVFDSSMLPFV